MAIEIWLAKKIIYLLTLLFVIGIDSTLAQENYEKPNIILILADDLGYGDIASYDPDYAQISTPNADRLVEQGMYFTDAHTPSAVCTPTRYGLLTGRYAWRTRLQKHVLRPFDPPLISAERLTVGDLLKNQGYKTALIGKWHLGMKWPMRNNRIIFDEPIAEGPTTRGFDYYFGNDVPNYPPYTFIENDQILAPPTEYFLGNKEMVLNYEGPIAPGWQFDQIMPTLVNKGETFVRNHAKAKKPFFLCMSLTIPHEPIAPSESFQGRSGIAPEADLIMEVDWALGQVMKALDKHGLTNNTLLIFTSDNGHSSYTGGLEALQQAGHRVSGPFRGVKSNIWEGGHRVPFIVRWPGIVDPGSHSDQMIVLTDMLATVADIVNINLPDNAGEDSKSILPLLEGNPERPVRDSAIFHSADGRFAIREGQWKLILGPGSGGYGTEPSDETAIKQGLPSVQLYNLKEDPGETTNLQADHPAIVERLKNFLEQYVLEGRTTQGTPQENDVKVISNITPD